MNKQNHFKIITTFCNVEKWIHLAIRSIQLQEYKNFQCILVDDASTDNTVSVIEKNIKNDDRFVLIKNGENVGALENIFNGINASSPEDEDIIVNLDGDDWFSGPNVLDRLNEEYQNKNCWMTYGSHVTHPGNKRSKFCLRPVPDHIIDNNLFRESPWMTSALRTFKYKLWKNIKEEDLKDSSGHFYTAAWDLAYMFPMLEMAGHRAKFIEDILYVYNLHDNNDHVVPEKRKKQLLFEQEVRSKKKYERLNKIKTNYEDRFVVDEPLDLLTALRFDIPAKTLYARHREKGVEDVVAKSVYEHHLDVWGGFTEKKPAKNGIEDFYNSYHSVLESMKEDGFDEEKSFVPVSDQGFLLNGAHRTSAAIHYGKPLVCKKSHNSAGQLLCSFQYFMNKKDVVPSGLDRKCADQMALEYARLKKNIFMASVYEHSLPHFQQIGKIFAKHGVSIVYYKDFDLTEKGKLNYVISLYSGEVWIGNQGNKYPGARQQASLSFAGGSKVVAVLLECDSLTKVNNAKNEIRELIGIGKPSIHITDTYDEAWRNATLCFHDKSLQFINEAKVGAFNDLQLRNLSEKTRKIVEDSDLEIEDVCVGGSAPLALYGLRMCRDFDIVHRESKLGLKFDNDVSSHNPYLKFYADTPERMIFDPEKHIYVHGIKFITLEGMVQMKRKRGEEKDERDNQMAKSVLEPKNIVILAAGPPKPGRNRHLEKFNGTPLIDSVIEKCSFQNTKLFVVVAHDNPDLREHISANHDGIEILTPEDHKIRSTFSAALTPDGDCIMVCGDLKGLKRSDVENFIFSDYSSATCHYQIPWGGHRKSPRGNVRRGDVGDCISMIAQKHKKEFLSEENYNRAKSLFEDFYPGGNQHKGMNEFWYNDVGTFTSFAFFEEIWSNPNRFSSLDKGVVSFDHKIYEDND
jgi:glycosyltransferase involved in cell wall biosynthesis